jgi:hypothetical protein
VATSPLPSSSAGASTAPPNFYAQAATAQPPAAAPANNEDTTKFRNAIGKLLEIFDKIEKLKPNGTDISKDVKGVAQSLKDLREKVFEGDEGETDSTGAASPPPVAPGGAPGTGAA